MKCTHNTLIRFSGAVWLAVGVYLLNLGTHFLLDTPQGPFVFWMESYSTSTNSALLLLVLALGIGYVKAKAIFSKTVQKGVTHIRSLPPLTPFYALYTPKYLLLLALMMGLGLAMKWFSTPLDIRGFVDVAVGSALIHGSFMYFKEAQAPQTN